MKRLITSFFLLLLFALTHAQNQAAFKSIGKKQKVYTLSNDRFDESFINDSIQQIGSVVINAKTGQIIKLLAENEIGTAEEDLIVGSRFLSVDPLSRKFPELTPYQYASNRPIDGIDLDGLEWAIYTYKVYKDNLGRTHVQINRDSYSNTIFDGTQFWLRPEGSKPEQQGICFDSFNEMWAAAAQFAFGQVDYNAAKKAFDDGVLDRFMEIMVSDLATQGHGILEGYMNKKVAGANAAAAGQVETSTSNATNKQAIAANGANQAAAEENVAAKATISNAGPSLKTAGGKTINNSKWANQQNPMAASKGFNVPVKANGYPDFSEYLYTGGVLKTGVQSRMNTVKINMTGTYTGDFSAANKAAGFTKTPDGFTWHHSEVMGEMQLIQTEAHQAARHSGGVQLYKDSHNGKGY